MPFDFNPDLEIEEDNQLKEEKVEQQKLLQEEEVTTSSIAQQESQLIVNNTSNSEVITVNNLLGLTQSHINDDIECRKVVNDLTEELNNSIQLMSIKEILEYLKVKLKEREFHCHCIFKAYEFIQRSEFARETLIGSSRKERIIQATDRTRINGLLSILNS